MTILPAGMGTKVNFGAFDMVQTTQKPLYRKQIKAGKIAVKSDYRSRQAECDEKESILC